MLSTAKKWLELINDSSKVAGYKTNIQKLVAFLYASNEIPEKEINKAIQNSIRPIQYLIHLTKGVKDLYTVNYKTQMKRIESDTNKWEDTHVHGL